MAFPDSKVVRHRILITGVVLIVVSIVIIARLVFLQVIAHGDYVALSQQNRIDTVPVPPVRGLIFDRNGKILARNDSSHEIVVVPERVDNMEQLLEDISDIVPVNEDELVSFNKSIKQGTQFDSHVLKEFLTEEEIARFAVNNYRLSGAGIQVGLKRYYPYADATAHVVGRVGRINLEEKATLDPTQYRGVENVGKLGAEIIAEDVLVGNAGHKQLEINAHGRPLRVLSKKPSQAGLNVYLTIDSGLQEYIHELLGEEKGAAIAMEPSTGRVLAMVSKPSYDVNDLVSHASGNKFQELVRLEERPLINRVVQGLYSPGSVFKLFMAYAAYEEFGHPPRLFCPGFYRIPGKIRKYRCWKKEGHGVINMRQAIEQSCDVYFYILASKLGIDNMHYYVSQFGLGEKTDIGLPEEVNGLLPSREWKKYTRNESWYAGETLITGIGQGFTLTTMAQLAQATAIIANRGLKYKPQLILKTENSDTGETFEVEPELLDEVTPKDSRTYDRIIEAMIDVVHGNRGTARGINRGIEYQIAGKTGTVQLIRKKQDEEWDPDKVKKKFHPHGIFVGFAPIDDPKIVTAVIVENSNSAAAIAAPLTRKIMDYYLLGKVNSEAAGAQ